MNPAGNGQEASDTVNDNRPSAGSALRQYVLSAEVAASGPKVVDVIKQILELPSIYVFGELLDVANVKALSGTGNEPYLNLLRLFAYGTYSDYLRQEQAHPGSLPPLSSAMVTKLRQLSIVSLARSRRHIPYQILLQELDISNIRELEDIIIDVIYANVIKGTMDQQNSRLEIDQTIGRDVREEDFQTITNVLNEWCRNCDNILSNIEHQMTVANLSKEESNNAKQILESKIAAVRKNIKLPDNDDVIMTEVNNAFTREEKLAKRNSSKFKSGYKGGVTKSWRKDLN